MSRSLRSGERRPADNRHKISISQTTDDHSAYHISVLSDEFCLRIAKGGVIILESTCPLLGVCLRIGGLFSALGSANLTSLRISTGYHPVRAQRDGRRHTSDSI